MRVTVDWFVEGLRRNKDSDGYVIIDVLSFSTSMATAFISGFTEAFVFSDFGEALAYSHKIRAPLLAEIQGVKPPEADIDNSPLELLSYVARNGVNEGRLVARSTSGAIMLEESMRSGCQNVFLGALVNSRYVARAVNDLKIESLAVLCSGFNASQFAIEDFLGAGLLVHELKELGRLEMDDAALTALELYSYVKDNVVELMKSGINGRRLRDIKREKDIEFAGRTNSIKSLPYADAGKRALRPYPVAQ